jgi:hypothetical protein
MECEWRFNCRLTSDLLEALLQWANMCSVRAYPRQPMGKSAPRHRRLVAKFVQNRQNSQNWTVAMKTMSAKDAKNGFGRLIDIARAEPVTIEKHGRAVVVVRN